MQEKVKGTFRQVTNKWFELEKGQRNRIVIIGVILVAVLGLLIFMMAKPKMVVLSSGLDAVTVGEIQTALDDAGIKSKPTKNATAIEVEQKDAIAAQLALASTGIRSSSGGGITYEDALSFSGMGTTESVKVENFKRLKQDDLARDLLTIEGVTKASVELALPATDNYFAKSEEEASAGVWLVLDKPMEKTQAAAIARFIASSVEGLSMENVTIIDQEGKELYNGVDGLASGSPSSEYDMEMTRKSEMESKIKAQLSFLYDEVKPSVNLVLDWDKRQEKDKIFTSPVQDSPTGLVNTETTENRSATGTDAAEAPGTDTNNAAAPNYAIGGGTATSANEKNRVTDYLHNETESTTDKSIGGIKVDESSASVFVYKYKRYDQAQMEKDKLLDGTTWEAFKEAQKTPVPLTIDPVILNSLQTGTRIQNFTIVGYEVPVFQDKVVAPVNIQQIVMFAILAILILLLAFGIIRSNTTEEVTEIEPELSVEDLLVSTQLEEQREAELSQMTAIDFGKDSEVKRLIEKFVTEKPEAVAALLRNWLNDDWE